MTNAPYLAGRSRIVPELTETTAARRASQRARLRPFFRNGCGPWHVTVPTLATHYDDVATLAHGYESAGRLCGFRLVDASKHTRASCEWYTDDHASETLRAVVAILPRSRGFLAGYSGGDGMYGGVDRSTVWISMEDAARDASRLAERMAEEMRDDTREQAQAQAQEERDAAHVALLGERAEFHAAQCARIDADGVLADARAALWDALASGRNLADAARALLDAMTERDGAGITEHACRADLDAAQAAYDDAPATYYNARERAS